MNEYPTTQKTLIFEHPRVYQEQRYKMALEAIAALPLDGFYLGAKAIARAALSQEEK